MSDIEEATIKDTKKVTSRKSKTPSAIPEVLTRYKTAGWDVVRLNNTTLAASKGDNSRRKTHFITVYESHTGVKDQSDKSVEENNAYIQNAFSNQATPVYVFANYNEKKDAFDKILFKDINTGKSLRIVS